MHQCTRESAVIHPPLRQAGTLKPTRSRSIQQLANKRSASANRTKYKEANQTTTYSAATNSKPLGDAIIVEAPYVLQAPNLQVQAHCCKNLKGGPGKKEGPQPSEYRTIPSTFWEPRPRSRAPKACADLGLVGLSQERLAIGSCLSHSGCYLGSKSLHGCPRFPGLFATLLSDYTYPLPPRPLPLQLFQEEQLLRRLSSLDESQGTKPCGALDLIPWQAVYPEIMPQTTSIAEVTVCHAILEMRRGTVTR